MSKCGLLSESKTIYKYRIYLVYPVNPVEQKGLTQGSFSPPKARLAKGGLSETI